MSGTRPHLQTNSVSFSERDEEVELKWQQVRIRKICAILRNISEKETGADLGCMSGMATSIYQTTGIKTLHGYDISEASLNRLRAKGFRGFYWNADGEPCPAPDGTYDIVIAGEIIEHLVDTDGFAGEIHRILKPGGHVIVSTPNLVSWYNRIRVLRGLVPTSYPGTSSTLRKDVLIDLNHIRVNTLSEWIFFMESHNFHIKEVHGASHLQALEGGYLIRLIKSIDRLACHRPSLATNLIIVGYKPG